MKRTIFFLISCLLLMPAVVSAQEAAPAPAKPPIQLDLATAVGLAEKNNFALKGSQADVDGKRTAARSSFSIFYPSVSLDGNFSAGLTDPATSSASRNRLSAGLSAGVTLTPTMALQIKQAWNSYQAGLASYEQAYAALTGNVKKFYFGLVLLAEQVADNQKQADADKARYDVGAFKYKNGFMSEIDMLTLEYTWKNKVAALQTLQNNYEINLRQLKDICGIDPAADVVLTSAIPDVAALTFDPSAYSIDNDPDLKILTYNKTQAEISRDNAVAALLPTLSVTGRLSGGYSADPFAGSLFDASSWSWSGSLSLNLGLSIPLDAYLPYSQTRTTLLLQNAAVEKIKYTIADQRQAALRRADTLLLTLRQVRSQIDSLNVNVTLAQRNLALTEQLYNSGKKSFLDLKDAENSLLDAQVQLISAKNGYLSALLDLEYLYGADVGL
ncbi:MAG: TolC family protein [Spirochaetales bacterium]|nr:TolC family protein [Spirochaetales bacterium]